MLSQRWFATAETITALVIGLGVTTGAIAADLAPMPTKAPAVITPAPVINPWTFTATLYGWVPLMKGTVTVKGRTADVDVGYSDISKIVKESEIPKDLAELAGSFEARNDRFSIFSDVVYLKIAQDGSMFRTRGGDFVNASVSASATLKYQMVIAELAAAYELVHWGSNATAMSGTGIDVYAGGRLWWMQAELSAAISATLNILDLTFSGSRAIAKSPSVDWVDPLVGLRLRHQIVPGLNLTVSGDVGGFDVGSKFSWQSIAAVNYDFYTSKSVVWSGMLGYRALNVDYTQGSGRTLFVYDVTMHGPIIGVTARF